MNKKINEMTDFHTFVTGRHDKGGKRGTIRRAAHNKKGLLIKQKIKRRRRVKNKTRKIRAKYRQP